MRFLAHTFTLLSILLFTLSAHAGESAKGWDNSIELGAVKTNGNTQTLVLNSKAKLINEGVRIRDTITASANNSSDGGSTTAESYQASLQEDWKITERDYLFVRFGFESDRFAGFRRRFSETAGYGRDLIKTDKLRWNVEIGGGLRQSTLTNRQKTSEAIGRGATGLRLQINDSALFTEEISTEGGVKGWASKSETALQHRLNSHLASKISLKLEHNSNVPVGTKKLDIETAITMVVNF